VRFVPMLREGQKQKWSIPRHSERSRGSPWHN